MNADVEHTFLRSAGAITSFARVALTFAPGSEPLCAVLADAFRRDPMTGEHTPAEMPSWFDAARRGCERVIRLAATGASGRVVVTRVIGTLVDTDDDAVEVAATLATWQLLLPQRELPGVSSGRPWQVVFPDDPDGGA